MADRIGGFRIGRELADEGVARTLEAFAAGDRPATLRVAQLPGEVIAEIRERFEEEARRAEAVRHENVAAMCGFGVDEEQLYVAYEGANQTSLAQLLKTAGGKLPPRACALIALDVLRGLAHAHAESPPLLHRALAPSCIVIEREGRAKISDFSFGAALLMASSAYSRVLQSTCYYQSPEQVRARPLDPRTDLFSLGAVLYECVSGKRAFDAPTPLAVSLKVSMGTFAALDPKEVTAPLHELLRTLLKVDPAARGDATKAIALLAEMVGEPATARRELAALLGSGRDETPAPAAPAAPSAIESFQERSTAAAPKPLPVAPAPLPFPAAPAPSPFPGAAAPLPAAPAPFPPRAAPAPIPQPVAPRTAAPPVEMPMASERTALLQLPDGMQPGADDIDPGEFASFGDDDLVGAPTQIGVSLPDMEGERRSRPTMEIIGGPPATELPLERTQVLLSPPVAPGAPRMEQQPVRPSYQPPIPAAPVMTGPAPRGSSDSLQIVLLVAVSVGALVLLVGVVALAILLG